MPPLYRHYIYIFYLCQYNVYKIIHIYTYVQTEKASYITNKMLLSNYSLLFSRFPLCPISMIFFFEEPRAWQCGCARS